MFHRALPVLALLGLAAVSSAGSYYLALGDSAAFGFEISQSLLVQSNGDRGYVAPVADALGVASGTRPTVLNLAVVGETSTSFANTSQDAAYLNSNYGVPYGGRPSQQALATTAIATLGSQIKTVSFAIGANDYLSLTTAQQSDPTAIASIFASIDARYASVLGLIHTQLPNATLILPGYYNPYAIGDAAHDPAALAITTLNAKIQAYATQYRGRYVDFYTPIEGKQSTLIGVGDIHPNDAGYAVLGRAAVQAVPEPSSVAALGVAALVVLRRRKR